VKRAIKKGKWKSLGGGQSFRDITVDGKYNFVETRSPDGHHRCIPAKDLRDILADHIGDENGETQSNPLRRSWMAAKFAIDCVDIIEQVPA